MGCVVGCVDRTATDSSYRIPNNCTTKARARLQGTCRRMKVTLAIGRSRMCAPRLLHAITRKKFCPCFCTSRAEHGFTARRGCTTTKRTTVALLIFDTSQLSKWRKSRYLLCDFLSYFLDVVVEPVSIAANDHRNGRNRPHY